MRVVPVVKGPPPKKEAKKTKQSALGFRLPGDDPSDGHRKVIGVDTLR